jgi:hypothetical protein
MRKDVRSVVLERKLSGLKDPNHNLGCADIGEGIDESGDHDSPHEKRVYDLELHEHDFQPHDVG